MKYSLILLALTLSPCFADGPPGDGAKPVAELRKEHEETRGADGQVSRYIDTVYRGKECVLRTLRFAKKNKYGIQMSRAYFADSQEVVDELYYDDGTTVIRLYNKDILREMFRRKQDGSVEPVSSEELATLQAQQKEVMKTMEK